MGAVRIAAVTVIAHISSHIPLPIPETCLPPVPAYAPIRFVCPPKSDMDGGTMVRYPLVTLAQEMAVIDSDGNILMQVNDEGDAGG